MSPQVEAAFRPEHVNSPAMLSAPGYVDALADALCSGPVTQRMAQLFSRDRLDQSDGHELLVGVDEERQVGAPLFTDSSDNWVTVGAPRGQGLISYLFDDHVTEFPDGTDIPLESVREALKEFFLSEGRCPECVEWQVSSYR